MRYPALVFSNTRVTNSLTPSSTLHVIGSMMIDRVVRVAKLPRSGETVAALSSATYAGGKGANQAAAAAKCGARVRMLGRTGADGAFIRAQLKEAGVRVGDVFIDDEVSGAACVMVAQDGHNAIVIASESNTRITAAQIEEFLASARTGEIVLFQNECAHLAHGIACAAARGLRPWLNAAPADESLLDIKLEKLAGLVVNEVEAEFLTGVRDARHALELLASRMTNATVIITLGAQGAIAAVGSARYSHRGFVVDAVDTVGCGDAFVGAFLAAITAHCDVAQALARANAAGALTAMHHGAMRALPTIAEVNVASLLPEGTRLKQRAPLGDGSCRPLQCQGCGYDISAQKIGGKCPECAHPIVASAFTDRWTQRHVRATFARGATQFRRVTLWCALFVLVQVLASLVHQPNSGMRVSTALSEITSGAVYCAFTLAILFQFGMVPLALFTVAKGAPNEWWQRMLLGVIALHIVLMLLLITGAWALSLKPFAVAWSVFALSYGAVAVVLWRIDVEQRVRAVTQLRLRICLACAVLPSVAALFVNTSIARPIALVSWMLAMVCCALMIGVMQRKLQARGAVA